MYSRKYKGRCTKKRVSKCKEVVRLYDEIMIAYLDILEDDDNVVEIMVNVPFEDLPLGEYTTDFICVLKDGSYRVRECVFRNRLTHPITAKWMDSSRNYWLQRNVRDWGIVINEAE